MTQQLSPISVDLRTEGGLSAYMRAANAAPILTAEEEQDLALRYHRDDDLEAAQKLVISHLRYVVRVAKGFTGYGLAQADLIQEGNIGLMKAVKHFDPMRGVRLVSFAIHWIRAEIYDFILQNWKIVKVATTKAQRKLFFNLRKNRTRLGWMKHNEVEKLARDLDVPTETVLQMEGRMSLSDASFDASSEDADKDDAYMAPAAYLQDMSYNPETLVTAADSEQSRKDQLTDALTGLDERSRDIVARRWLAEKKPTLHELADEYGVSAERIRQIEKKALGQMRELLATE
jgi:RNA polymerase sigma-32 factor